MTTKPRQAKQEAPQAPAEPEDVSAPQEAPPEAPEAPEPVVISEGRHAPHHQKGV